MSDLHIKVKGQGVRTWLDEYQKEELKLGEKEAKFEEQEEKLREIEREKGRKEAEKGFNKAILPSIRALHLDPFDVKPILNPIDFVVFNGMNKKGIIKDVLFLSKEHNLKTLKESRKRIREAIIKKKYDWQVARIEETGKIEFE